MTRRAGLALTLALAAALGVLAVVLVVVPAPGPAAPAAAAPDVVESAVSLNLASSGLLSVSQPRGRPVPASVSGTVLLSGPAGGRLVVALQQSLEDGGLAGPVQWLDVTGERSLFRGSGTLSRDGRLAAVLTGQDEYAGTTLRLSGMVEGAGLSRPLQWVTVDASTLSALPAPDVVVQPLAEVWPWYASRTGGLLAWLLATGAVMAGILVGTRAVTAGPARFGLFEVHRTLAVLALFAVLVHVFVLLLDRYVGFSLVQLLVPFASPYEPVWVGLGVVAFYLLLVVVPSFWVRDRIGYRTWRAIHYATYGIFALAVMHGLFAGTDTRTPLVAGMMTASVAAVTVLTIWRVTGSGRPGGRAAAGRAGRPGRAPLEDVVARPRSLPGS